MSNYIVGVAKGTDKYSLLEDVIEKAGLLANLGSVFSKSDKQKEEFSIVIKPNLMMFTHKEDPPATYTDPELVEHLIQKLNDAGHNNIKVVEAQNIYGNWYENRTVENVARAAGYKPGTYGYRICDLTEDTVEYDYRGKLQKHPVGKAWKDADFRISFAKNKTHISNLFTLTLKNVYGTLPAQDKAMEYHAKREWYEATLDNLKSFPVHFGIIDAFYSADGILGFKGTALPKQTNMVLASSSLIAVDMVSAKMMGVNPMRSILTKLAIQEWGKPDIDLIGIDHDYVYPNWDNLLIKGRITRFLFNLLTRLTGRRPEVPYVLSRSYLYHLLQEEVPELWQRFSSILEESYLGFNISGIISNGLVGDTMDTDLFPRKKRLSQRLVEKSMENLEDLINSKKRRKEFLRDLLENLSGG
jgi:uncharacterized protein (DUF362 family)